MKTELRALTIARFFAALYVVFFHWHGWSDSVGFWMGGGSVAVIFFFVLSGFVLAFSAREGASTRDFYVRRVARIYPVYLLAWATFGVWYAGDVFRHTDSVTYAAKSVGLFGGLSALLVQAWVPRAAWEWNLPGWSLSVEVLFYLLFPFLIAPLMRCRSRALIAIALVACGLNLLCRIPMLSTTPILSGTAFESTKGHWLEVFPPFYLFVFIVGACLGLLYRKLGSLRHPLVWLGVSCLGIIGCLAIRAVPGSLWNGWAVIPFGLAIYALAGLRVQEGPISNRLVALGHASYAMYILQDPMRRLFSDTSFWTSFGMYVVFLICVSAIVYTRFERPLEKAIRERFTNKGKSNENEVSTLRRAASPALDA